MNAHVLCKTCAQTALLRAAIDECLDFPPLRQFETLSLARQLNAEQQILIGQSPLSRDYF